MGKILFVTLAFNRPDFIELQYNSLRKWVGDFDYTVFDNCPYDMVEKECERLGINRIKVNSQSGDPSWAVGMALNQMWQHLKFETRPVMYLDSDMFLINRLPDFGNCDIAFVPQHRAGGITYPWTGLMYFNMETLPAPEKMRWEVAYEVKGADVGGLNHFWLKEYAPIVKELEMWTLIDEGKFSLNGEDTKINHDNFTRISARIKGFPRPYSVDMFKVKGADWGDCFVFHYKTGSNYAPHCTDEYNQLKTKALLKILNV